MKKNKEFALHEVKTKKEYFEGWYYKIQIEDIIFSVIFGMNQNENELQGFIQTIDTIRNASYQKFFPWEEITIKENPYEVYFGENMCSETRLVLNLKKIGLKANIDFLELTPIRKNVYMPTIMGPFFYFPMECVHAIISLHHQCRGLLQYENKEYDVKGIGYIEKDRGVSFPRKYVWFQSNECGMSKSSFFISLATIPFLGFSFTGVICILLLQEEQIRFATYLGSKIKQFELSEENGKKYVNIQIVQNIYCIEICIVQEKGYELKAPSSGRMSVKIHEHLNSESIIHIYKHNKLMWEGVFKKGASEIVE